jgi:hypothetical protein
MNAKNGGRFRLAGEARFRGVLAGLRSQNDHTAAALANVVYRVAPSSTINNAASHSVTPKAGARSQKQLMTAPLSPHPDKATQLASTKPPNPHRPRPFLRTTCPTMSPAPLTAAAICTPAGRRRPARRVSRLSIRTKATVPFTFVVIRGRGCAVSSSGVCETLRWRMRAASACKVCSMGRCRAAISAWLPDAPRTMSPIARAATPTTRMRFMASSSFGHPTVCAKSGAQTISCKRFPGSRSLPADCLCSRRANARWAWRHAGFPRLQ